MQLKGRVCSAGKCRQNNYRSGHLANKFFLHSYQQSEKRKIFAKRIPRVCRSIIHTPCAMLHISLFQNCMEELDALLDCVFTVHVQRTRSETSRSWYYQPPISRKMTGRCREDPLKARQFMLFDRQRSMLHQTVSFRTKRIMFHCYTKGVSSVMCQNLPKVMEGGGKWNNPIAAVTYKSCCKLEVFPKICRHIITSCLLG
jgi:hypothetical protein